MIITTRIRQGGFTLIEMLVVLGMLGIVISATYSLYSAHQRTAYVDEEVVDVQQNLHIAMDTMSRDIMMAGFLIGENDFARNLPNPNPGSPGVDMAMPVGRIDDNTGLMQPPNLVEALLVAPPDDKKTDALTLNMALANAGMALVQQDEPGTAISPGTSITLSVNEVDYFEVDPIRQVVRVIRPSKPGIDLTDPKLPNNYTFSIEGVGRTAADCPAPDTAPCLQLKNVVGLGGEVTIQAGDVVIRTGTILSESYPTTVVYSLTPGKSSTCPADQSCLSRTENGTTQVVASNIVGFQVSYLLDDNTESRTPPDLQKIKAVRVNLFGQAVETSKISGETRENVSNVAKTRQIMSVVKIRNRSLMM